MPLYTYKEDATGELVDVMSTIAERDNQPGLTRQLDVPASVWSPTANGGMS